MRKSLLAAGALVAAAALGGTLVACSGTSSKESGNTSSETNSNSGSVISNVIDKVASDAAKQGKAAAKNSEESSSSSDSSVEPEYGITPEELAAPGLSVVYGDYDAMSELASKIQNGEMDGEIVTIDGDISHLGTSYSIVQKSADGSKKIGTNFVIDGAAEADYPPDGERATITGKVCEVPGGYSTRVIVTLQEALSILA